MPYKDPEKQREAVRRWLARNRDRARELWRQANARRDSRPRSERPGFFTLERLDNWKLCMHGLYTSAPCRNRPRWRDGNWRVCDEHWSAGCQPLDSA